MERDQATLAPVVRCARLQAVPRAMPVVLWQCMLALVAKAALSTFGVEMYRSPRAPVTPLEVRCASQRLRVALRWRARVLPCSAAAVGILE